VASLCWPGGGDGPAEVQDWAAGLEEVHARIAAGVEHLPAIVLERRPPECGSCAGNNGSTSAHSASVSEL
jgi:hypothetical protein